MKHKYLIEMCGIPSSRTCHSNQFKGSQVRADKNDSNGISRQHRSTIQRRGIKIRSPGNRPCHRAGDPNQDMRRRIQRSIGMRRTLSRQYIRRNSLSTPSAHTFQLTSGKSHCNFESEAGYEGHLSNKNISKIGKRFRSSALTLLHSGSVGDIHQISKGISGSLRHPSCGLLRAPIAAESLSRNHISNQGSRHSQGKKQENTVNTQPKENMERPEDCFHCRDLNMEFNEVRAQQRALEDLVRSMENRMEDKVRILENRLEEQVKILHDKYRAEMNLFLHRVHSLHEQYSELHNRCIHAEERCIHAEEKIDALKKMLEKKEATSSSSVKPIEVDLDPEGSTARKMSHIEID